MGVEYREEPVDAALRPWVAALWRVRALGTEAVPHRVLPDGCMDLVVASGGDVQVAGPSTVAFEAPLAAGAQAFGVRFRPGAAPALLGARADALLDASPLAHELWGDDGRRLQERVVSAGDPLAVLAAEVRRRIAGAAPPDPLVRAGAEALHRRPGLPAGALARELAVSERHLRRRFHAAVGYGPKRLARVLRLQRALGLGDEHSLAERAVLAGYADQAHFTGDCRELAGVPPGRFLQDRGIAVGA